MSFRLICPTNRFLSKTGKRLLVVLKAKSKAGFELCVRKCVYLMVQIIFDAFPPKLLKIIDSYNSGRIVLAEVK